ncbi:MAG: deoxyribodipyrimidine photolyase [Cyanobacteria bacterium SIG26]|nr:deoxyribodipyrimidine photolyase [Cyanobacteria bacterium SIG26]
MTRVTRNTLLNYIPDNFVIENEANFARIYEFNNKSIKNGEIFYLCEREIRVKDNFALLFAIEKSKELNLSLKIIHPKINCGYQLKQIFIDNQISQAKKQFKNTGLDFEIINKTPHEIIKEINPAILIIDFNPILNRDYLKNSDYKIYEIDGHNIVPARFVSDKQEYSAATLRSKIYHNIYFFLTDYKNITKEKVEADFILEDFIKNKLQYYAEYKNDPSKNVLSGLSKYLNLGFISSQRVALEIIKSRVKNMNKEVFLEELIVRKELADNFCLYADSFKDFSGIPNWAKLSLNNHSRDFRPYLYLPQDLENAKTHDKLWNATQNQLKKEGIIHGYLRMYWVKKILEWTIHPKEALEVAIYLNDKYAYDSPSANGYVGILWGIGGLHDRAFIDYPISGKIRRMSYSSLRKKFELSNYIEKY